MHDAPALTRAALRAAAEASSAATPCAACARLAGAGWEAMPAGFDDDHRLRALGPLRARSDDEPTLAEHHPAGTHYWSPDAPIAPAFFPFNRCVAWQCSRCARAWLRYTEYGGYYQEERIRPLVAALLVDA